MNTHTNVTAPAASVFTWFSRAVYCVAMCCAAAFALTAEAQVASASGSGNADQRLPIFDGHLHYSHDAAELIPPDKAIAILRAAGLKYAVVSSSNDEGTQKLRALAPEMILPSLRPYRSRADTSTWLSTDAVLTYMKDRLAKYRYVAIGEFHVYGDDARLPIMKATVELAKKHQLILHSHSDAKAIDILFEQDPSATILWAHSGFDQPDTVAQMLAKYPRLFCDLAFRSDYVNSGELDPNWRKLFDQFPDRFMAGTDTFTPERWAYIGDYAQWVRGWIGKLPSPLKEKIAYQNGEALFKPFQARMQAASVAGSSNATASAPSCDVKDGWQRLTASKTSDRGDQPAIFIRPSAPLALSKLFSVDVSTCSNSPLQIKAMDAVMPEHRHGMNYKPSFISTAPSTVRANGLLLHMQGKWEWQVDALVDGRSAVRFTAPFSLN